MGLRPDPSNADERSAAPEHWVTLRGVGALAEGQQLKISVGASLVVGRSRHCDWSVRRSPEFLKSDKEARQRIKDDTLYSSVSRKHARITYLAPDMLEIKNLSGNGTLVDGVNVDKIVLTDVRTREHLIRLGPEGVELELAPGSLPI